MVGSKHSGALTDDASPVESEAADGSMAKIRSSSSVNPVLSGRVLVIDDEVAVGRTIQRLLGERHDVVVLTSGLEAIKLIEGGAEFHVILCDMSMPEVTGMDLYARVVETRPELAKRFVFMTGGTFSAKARQFFDGVAAQRIDKPFDSISFARSFATALPKPSDHRSAGEFSSSVTVGSRSSASRAASF